jgi:3'(2'), 5'-bisphosphate nucleotidase
MLNKLYTDIFVNIKKKIFDDFIIDVANKCIDYIAQSDIKILNNKVDGTPLSVADLEVDNIIRKSLGSFNPNIKILSEEYNFSLNNYLDEYYWLIDPIDGTKSYISGGEEYTVNIALIYKGNPYLGLIAHPPSKKIWYAKNKKLIIINNNLQSIYDSSQKSMRDYPTAIISKENNSELEIFLKGFKNLKRISFSSSLKLCKLAENQADFYPRFSSISKWDIAAGHAILNASGGELTDFYGKKLKYNNKSSKTGKFIALATKETRKNFNIYHQLK